MSETLTVSGGATENFIEKLTANNDDEIPHGSPIKLEVLYPDIEHPIYGKLTGVRKDVQMVLPKG